MSSDYRANIEAVLSNINSAVVRSGRKLDELTLVAVSKKQSASSINSVCSILKCQNIAYVFGESYIQEFMQKKQALDSNINVHLIGALQSNKVAKAVINFDCIESVHSEKILWLINSEAQKTGKQIPIFIQVNISNDQRKSGIVASEVERVAVELIPRCTGVSFHGIMTITELYRDTSLVRGDFKKMKQLSDKIEKEMQLKNGSLKISMGMSADYQIAIEEGATHLRIGSAIFGER